MPQQAFNPGFRLSRIDIFVLVTGTIGSTALSAMTWWWGFVVAFVVAHFFLFCNVFRLSRPLELAWSGVFVTLTSATVAFDIPGWIATTAASLTITALVVVIEMRKPSYHGVGWQRINPTLPVWWEARTRCESIVSNN